MCNKLTLPTIKDGKPATARVRKLFADNINIEDVLSLNKYFSIPKTLQDAKCFGHRLARDTAFKIYQDIDGGNTVEPS